MAQQAGVVSEQSNVIPSPRSNTIFWEEDNLSYNWKTDQWCRQPAWAGTTYFESENPAFNLGLVVFNGNAADIQSGFVGALQTATITTAAKDLNQGGRVVVNGVRPLVNGGTNTVRVGVQDSLGDSPTWSSSTTPNTRSGKANFRSEGRYVRAELTITGGFTTALGADVDFAAKGRV